LRSIARHLEQLAPRLAATHVAQSVINWNDFNFPEAERDIREAIKANPNYEFAHTYYSWLLDCYGRTDEALAQLKISQKLAPSKVIVFRCFGNTYYAARDYTNAIAWYRQAIAWEPHHFVAWHGVGTSLMALGDYTNALPYLETNEMLNGADPVKTRQSYALLRRRLNEQGIRGYWMQEWKWAESDTNADFFWKAEIQAHLGNTNAALDLLEQSYATHEGSGDYEPPLGTLLYDYDLDALHDQPRFKKLLDELGYTKVMKPGPK
jgi:tetratricopeptide (TPR) repeat protein